MYKKFICDDCIVYAHILPGGMHIVVTEPEKISSQTIDLASKATNELICSVKTTAALTKDEFETVVALEYTVNKE